MAQFADIEGLRQATNLQTALVLREVRLAEEAIRSSRSIVKDAAPVFRGRPTAIILPFPSGTHRRRG